MCSNSTSTFPSKQHRPAIDSNGSHPAISQRKHSRPRRLPLLTSPTQAVQLHYKGQTTHFIVYASSRAAVREFAEDPESGSLVATVDLYKVYTTDSPGDDRLYREASSVTLHNEFGSHNLDDCLREIITRGELLERAE